MAPDIQRRLMAAAGLVIIALTAVAFWLSYAHLAEIAAAHGLDGERAWAWPATLDAFIVAGELLMLRAAFRDTADPWAIVLTVAGSGGSIALNVWGVGNSAAPIDYVVAGVPPTAALLAFGALMRQIHEHYRDTETRDTGLAETDPQCETETSETPAADTGLAQTPAAPAETETRSRETAEPTPLPAAPTKTSETETPETTAVPRIRDRDRATETQHLLDLMWSRGGGGAVSLKDAETETGRPKATAAKRLKAARELHASGVRRIAA